MAAPLILARTFKDAHTFAREQLGLSHGYYRVVNSAGTIKAVRGVDLYLVPGWNKRPDRFTMTSAIKWCRLNVIDVATQPIAERWVNDDRTRTIAARYNAIYHTEPALDLNDFVEVQRPGSAEATDPFTAFLTAGVTPEAPEPVAVCVDCGLDPHAPDCDSNTLETLTPTPAEVSEARAVAEDNARLSDEAPKKNRRRRKCAKCEQLHFKGDPCVGSE